MVQKKVVPKPVPKKARGMSSGPMTKPRGVGGTMPKRPGPKRY